MTESATGDAIELLRWDSDHFGFPVARVLDPGGPEQIRAAVEAADNSGVRCLTALIATDRTEAITAAEEAGFRCYDVRVELDRQVGAAPESLDGQQVRLATEADLSSLEPIARTRSFATRFSADPHFAADLVGRLYVEWLRRGLRGEDRLLIVTNELDGFIVCRVERKIQVGTIELIAVAADSEGVGLGSRLVQGAETLFADTELKWAQVVTQGRNLSAQRLYQRHGYRTSCVKLWLHRWALTR